MSPISRRTQIDTFWLLVGVMMLAMGLIFFGWRGLLGTTATVLATIVAYLMAMVLLQLFWPRRQHDSHLHVLTMGLMLGVSLPVMREPLVPILAGITLGLLCHVIGRAHIIRVHPVAAAIVLAWVLPYGITQYSRNPYAGRGMVTEPAVLQLDNLVLGDLYESPSGPMPMMAWWEETSMHQYQAVRKPEPVRMLLGSDIPREPSRMADLLSQNRLPRVEEMLLGCVPGPIGATSKAVIIILGVYIMYRGLAWWPMAVGGVLAAVMTMALIPLKVDGDWKIMGGLIGKMGPAMGFVYVGYFLLAGPLLWILLILAPSTAPMSSKGKIIYGVIIGVVASVAMFYTGQWASAFVGLMLASALTRKLDGLQKSPMLSNR